MNLLLLLIPFLLLSSEPSELTKTYSVQKTESKSSLLKSDSSNFSKNLQTELVEHILPFWEGTQWDFNGYTNTPNDGVIACGYLVSTTLKHLGFTLNRYDIAKMYSQQIAEVLCFNETQSFEMSTELKTHVAQLKDGIYILGLSNHVGFLEIKNKVPYFIHSDYTSDLGVRRELFYNSDAAMSSNVFWIGNLSNNPKVFDAYKNKKEFK
ncbi:MAG: hypothetical protein ACI9N1_002399 [Flavobacteriales bacterium]|jgi:hypothetical protein